MSIFICCYTVRGVSLWIDDTVYPKGLQYG
jgi:hypothetical protein